MIHDIINAKSGALEHDKIFGIKRHYITISLYIKFSFLADTEHKEWCQDCGTYHYSNNTYKYFRLYNKYCKYRSN